MKKRPIRILDDCNLSTDLLPTIGSCKCCGGVRQGDAFINTNTSINLKDQNGDVIPRGMMIIAKISNPGQFIVNWILQYTV